MTTLIRVSIRNGPISTQALLGGRVHLLGRGLIVQLAVISVFVVKNVYIWILLPSLVSQFCGNDMTVMPSVTRGGAVAGHDCRFLKRLPVGKTFYPIIPCS